MLVLRFAGCRGWLVGSVDGRLGTAGKLAPGAMCDVGGDIEEVPGGGPLLGSLRIGKRGILAE